MPTLQGVDLFGRSSTFDTLPTEIITAVLLQLHECEPDVQHISSYKHTLFQEDMRSCALVSKCIHRVAQPLHDREILLSAEAFSQLEEVLANKTPEEGRSRLSNVRKVTVMESLEHSFDTTASLSALTSRLGEMRLTHLRVLFDEWHSDKLLPTFGLTLSTIPSDCLVELRLTLMDNNISESFGLVKASHRTLVRLSLRDGVEQRRHIHQAVVSNIPILSAVRYLTFGATSREAGDGRLIKPFIHMAVTASQLLDLTLQGEHWDPEYVFDILRACVGPIEKMTLDGSFSYFELYEMAKSSGRGHAFPRIRYLRMAEVFDGLDDLKFLPELFPTLTSVTFDYIDGTDAEGLSVLLLNPFSLPMLEEVSIGLFLHNREFPKALAELREICKERRIDLDIWDIG